jgi:hypothetical protein
MRKENAPKVAGAGESSSNGPLSEDGDRSTHAYTEWRGRTELNRGLRQKKSPARSGAGMADLSRNLAFLQNFL